MTQGQTSNILQGKNHRNTLHHCPVRDLPVAVVLMVAIFFSGWIYRFNHKIRTRSSLARDEGRDLLLISAVDIHK